jgi:hypothetical protein
MPDKNENTFVGRVGVDLSFYDDCRFTFDIEPNEQDGSFIGVGLKLTITSLIDPGVKTRLILKRVHSDKLLAIGNRLIEIAQDLHNKEQSVVDKLLKEKFGQTGLEG